MKASDISDEQIYELVAAAKCIDGRPCSLMSYDAVDALPQFPEKVVLAKLRLMVANGRLRGCHCGCRGDFRFPWEDFGGNCAGRDAWREKMAEYLASGKRVYGY